VPLKAALEMGCYKGDGMDERDKWWKATQVLSKRTTMGWAE